MFYLKITQSKFWSVSKFKSIFCLLCQMLMENSLLKCILSTSSITSAIITSKATPIVTTSLCLSFIRLLGVFSARRCTDSVITVSIAARPTFLNLNLNLNSLRLQTPSKCTCRQNVDSLVSLVQRFCLRSYCLVTLVVRSVRYN